MNRDKAVIEVLMFLKKILRRQGIEKWKI